MCSNVVGPGCGCWTTDEIGLCHVCYRPGWGEAEPRGHEAFEPLKPIRLCRSRGASGVNKINTDVLNYELHDTKVK